MKKKLGTSFLASFFLTVFLLGGSALAASVAEQAQAALAKKDLAPLRALLDQGPGAIDDVVKALLKAVQQNLTSDPGFAQQSITMAGQYATQITPPTVPSVCADMRRIAESVAANQPISAPLYSAVAEAARSFAEAPVVVAAGRPNLCEEAWLQIANLAGDPLLAQTSVHRDPRPVPPPPPIPPSAD